MPAASASSKRRLVRNAGLTCAVILSTIGIFLVVLGKTPKMMSIGILVGLWGILVGYLATGEPRRRHHSEYVDEDGVDHGAQLAMIDDFRERYEMQLEVMLRREIERVLRDELASLRSEVSGLRGEMNEKFDGQLRLERIETTRVIGSDIQSLQAEVRRLAVRRDEAIDVDSWSTSTTSASAQSVPPAINAGPPGATFNGAATGAGSANGASAKGTSSNGASANGSAANGSSNGSSLYGAPLYGSNGASAPTAAPASTPVTPTPVAPAPVSPARPAAAAPTPPPVPAPNPYVSSAAAAAPKPPVAPPTVPVASATPITPPAPVTAAKPVSVTPTPTPTPTAPVAPRVTSTPVTPAAAAPAAPAPATPITPPVPARAATPPAPVAPNPVPESAPTSPSSWDPFADMPRIGVFSSPDLLPDEPEAVAYEGHRRSRDDDGVTDEKPSRGRRRRADGEDNEVLNRLLGH